MKVLNNKNNRLGKKINSRGISLIVLVITIIVMIILAGVVLLEFSDDNPIGDANETKFKADLSAYKDELDIYIADKRVDVARMGQTYDPTDDTDLDDVTGANVATYISNFKDSYYATVKILDGELVYFGTDTTEIGWATEIGIKVQ